MRKCVDRLFSYQPSVVHHATQCRVRIYERVDGGFTVLATELADNRGMSITNAAEALASQLLALFQLDPATTRWIEHYTADSYREGAHKPSFDEVTFTWPANRQAHSPQWQQLTLEEVEILTGDDFSPMGQVLSDADLTTVDGGAFDDWDVWEQQ